jgi:enoyl-CoA hydratase
MPEVKFGSGIVTMLLPWLAGPKQARYLLLSADDCVSAAEVQAMGLVNRVVPAAGLFDEAIALGKRVAANDLLAVKLTKQAINRSLDAAGLAPRSRRRLISTCRSRPPRRPSRRNSTPS